MEGKVVMLNGLVIQAFVVISMAHVIVAHGRGKSIPTRFSLSDAECLGMVLDGTVIVSLAQISIAQVGVARGSIGRVKKSLTSLISDLIRHGVVLGSFGILSLAEADIAQCDVACGNVRMMSLQTMQSDLEGPVVALNGLALIF